MACTFLPVFMFPGTCNCLPDQKIKQREAELSQRPSGYPRQPNETYETPSWVTQVVGPYLRKHCLHIWDPANGPGSRIAQVLREEGFRVVATNDDFLTKTALPHDRIDAIGTNPPYGVHGLLACKFIAHSLELAPIVAMLLRIDFDSGKTRTNLFRDCPAFAHKIVLLDRIVWFVHKDKKGPSYNHAWFIWNAQHRGPATISYVSKRDCAEASRSRDHTLNFGRAA